MIFEDHIYEKAYAKLHATKSGVTRKIKDLQYAIKYASEDSLVDKSTLRNSLISEAKELEVLILLKEALTYYQQKYGNE